MRRRAGNPRNSFLVRYRLPAPSPIHKQNATTHPRQTPEPKKRPPANPSGRNDMRYGPWGRNDSR
jgi:hypothetical protein